MVSAELNQNTITFDQFITHLRRQIYPVLAYYFSTVSDRELPLDIRELVKGLRTFKNADPRPLMNALGIISKSVLDEGLAGFHEIFIEGAHTCWTKKHQLHKQVTAAAEMLAFLGHGVVKQKILSEWEKVEEDLVPHSEYLHIEDLSRRREVFSLSVNTTRLTLEQLLRIPRIMGLKLDSFKAENGKLTCLVSDPGTQRALMRNNIKFGNIMITVELVGTISRYVLKPENGVAAVSVSMDNTSDPLVSSLLQLQKDPVRDTSISCEDLWTYYIYDNSRWTSFSENDIRMIFSGQYNTTLYSVECYDWGCTITAPSKDLHQTVEPLIIRNSRARLVKQHSSRILIRNLPLHLQTEDHLRRHICGHTGIVPKFVYIPTEQSDLAILHLKNEEEVKKILGSRVSVLFPKKKLEFPEAGKPDRVTTKPSTPKIVISPATTPAIPTTNPAIPATNLASQKQELAMANLEKELKKLREENKALNSEYCSLKNEFEKAKLEISEKGRALEKMREDSENSEKKSREVIEALKSENLSLKNELAMANLEKTEKEREFQNLEKFTEKIQLLQADTNLEKEREVKKLREELEISVRNSDKQMELLKSEKDKFLKAKLTIEEKDRKLAKGLKIFVKKSAQIMGLKQKLQSLTSENISLKNGLQKLREGLEASEKKLAQEKSVSEKLYRDNSDLIEKLGVLERKSSEEISVRENQVFEGMKIQAELAEKLKHELFEILDIEILDMEIVRIQCAN